MPKEKSPPVNLDKYLEGRNHKYMTYEKASQLYGLPYWGFVSMAKEAKATWKLRKTAIVDIGVFEKYLEEQGIHITREQARVFVKELNRFRKRHKDWKLVEVQGADGDIVDIRL